MVWRRATRAGAIAGLVSGCLVALALNLWPEFQWLGIHPGVYGAVVNVIVLVVVSLRTTPPDAARIEPYLMRVEE